MQSCHFSNRAHFHLHLLQLPQQSATITQELHPPKANLHFTITVNQLPSRHISTKSDIHFHMALHQHHHSSNRCQSHLQRHPTCIPQLHLGFMARWPLTIPSSSLSDIQFHSHHTRVRQFQVSTQSNALPQKQQHCHSSQARAPRLLHPLNTPPNTFQHLCNIPHLSNKIPSLRLAYHHWPIQRHSSNSLWVAPFFLLPHPKSSSGQSTPINSQDQLQYRESLQCIWINIQGIGDYHWSHNNNNNNQGLQETFIVH